MRLNRSITTVVFLICVIAITGGCSTTNIDTSTQSHLSSKSALNDDSSKSYTERVTSTVGGYYNDTVSFLTDDCGVGAYSFATGKAVTYGIVGGVWGASKATMYGALHYSDSLEGFVIGAAVGSGLGLLVGVKNAYDGFKTDTAGCSS